MKELEDGDLLSIKYFWEEKEDIERYAYYQELLPQLKEKHPELIKAWEDYKISKKILSIVISSL